MMLNQQEKHLANLSALNDKRNSLNEKYAHYRELINNNQHSELVPMYAIVLQSFIFSFDLEELKVFFREIEDGEEADFATKCNLRMAALRVYERVQSFPMLHKNMKDLALKAGVVGDDAEYSKYFAALRRQRNELSKISSLRHTAGHYQADAVNFIKEIDSLVPKEIYGHAVMAVKIAAEFNKYMFATLTKCVERKTEELLKSLEASARLMAMKNNNFNL